MNDEALTLGRALAGLNAQSKGRRLGIFKPTPKEIKKFREQERGEEFFVELLGRALPAVNTDQGARAVTKSKPIEPEAVERYLESKFGDALPKVRDALKKLASSLKPASSMPSDRDGAAVFAQAVVSRLTNSFSGASRCVCGVGLPDRERVSCFC